MTKSRRQSVSQSINRTMAGRGCTFLLAVFSFTSCVFGQEIKAEVVSAFVWGEASPFGAISSIIQDPLTAYAINKLRYDPIEVSSRIGLRAVSSYEMATYVNYSTTTV